jgi:hypothetical protein
MDDRAQGRCEDCGQPTRLNRYCEACLADPPAGGLGVVECFECEGTGEGALPGRGDVCDVCGGRGRIRVEGAAL